MVCSSGMMRVAPLLSCQLYTTPTHRRHPNVYLEVSGIPPAKLLEYFPRLSEIAHKTVWGTDWPSPGITSMKANVEAFLALPLPDDVKAMILDGNARKLWA